jgi:tellurite methyltransferase
MAETDSERWAAYYKATKDRPPRETLMKALSLFAADADPGRPRFAIDLGCGSGMDTFELLRQGWKVLAIDAQSEAIELVRSSVPFQKQQDLETRVSTFEKLDNLPRADLVNASFSLPFCTPDAFDGLWSQIVAALHPGGRFAGHLFGDRDGWANNPNMTFHTHAEVNQRLRNFVVEMLNEEDEDGQTALGDPKHWHVFSLVARRR